MDARTHPGADLLIPQSNAYTHNHNKGYSRILPPPASTLNSFLFESPAPRDRSLRGARARENRRCSVRSPGSRLRRRRQGPRGAHAAAARAAAAARRLSSSATTTCDAPSAPPRQRPAAMGIQGLTKLLGDNARECIKECK
jgi:hypothetical protein